MSTKQAITVIECSCGNDRVGSVDAPPPADRAGRGGFHARIECSTCGVVGATHYHDYSREKAHGGAVIAWNRRRLIERSEARRRAS